MKYNYRSILQEINKYHSIVIFGHINPDGDCYGSQIGLREVLRLAYPEKKIYAVGSGLPAFFDYLGEMDQVSDETIRQSLALILDCSSPDRVEDQRVTMAIAQIKIDHHIEGGMDFCNPKLVDTKKCATAEMIAELTFQNKLPLNQVAASALFLGIVTDSGRFMYNATTDKTLQTAARLMRHKVDLSTLFDILYQNSEEDMQLKGYIYSHYLKTPAGLIYYQMDFDLLKSLGINPHKAASQVNLLSGLASSPIWMSICQKENGSYRVELRSRRIPVQPIALKYGGGGHAQAAGISFAKKEDLPSIIADLDELIQK